MRAGRTANMGRSTRDIRGLRTMICFVVGAQVVITPITVVSLAPTMSIHCTNQLLHALGQLLVAFEDAVARPDAVAPAVRVAARLAQRQGLDVQCDGDMLHVDGIAHSALTLVDEPVVRAMRQHGLRQLIVRQHARPRDIAQLAGILTRPGQSTGDGAARVAELDELRLWSVRLVPTQATERDATLPPAIERALEQIGAAGDATTCDTAVERLIAALTEHAWPTQDERTRAVAAGIARALNASHYTREALRTRTTTMIVAALADAIVSTDETVRLDAADAFRAAGSLGIEALVAHLAAASSIRRRRRCFEALLAVEGAVPTLIEALGHAQWYVVRNVAQILGERGATEACTALGRTLLHRDQRVRDAAAEALDHIGTPEARALLQNAIGNESAEVRRLAARAFLGGTLGASTESLSPTARLLIAFDKERDRDALVEETRALGVIGTPDAVQRLIRAAAGNARPLPVRLAALEALVAARGAAALPTLRSLRSDRDYEIRDAARRLESSFAA